MAIEKVLYAVRLPIDLKRQMDLAAESGGVKTAQLVVEALWKYLEKSSSTVRGGTGREESGLRVEESVSGIKPDMAALRAICAMPTKDVVETTLSGDVCPKTGYNEVDGETYRCFLQKGHRFNCKPGDKV